MKNSEPLNNPDGKIVEVNGPVVKGNGLENAFIGEQVLIGRELLLGEIIRMSQDVAVIQVYEDTSGLLIGDIIKRRMEPLSVELGPGLVGSIFDGLQRPLRNMADKNSFIERGSADIPLSRETLWPFIPAKQNDDTIGPLEIIGTVHETESFTHKIMVPHGVIGRISYIAPEGKYRVEDTVAIVKTETGERKISLISKYPVRVARPTIGYSKPDALLVSGQRVLDFFFPLAKGGAAIIPGGFGAGKTITQHQLAKWADADVIIYIGCGERGNEMVQVLDEFPHLTDPRNGRPLMERTVLIANTSNMPVTAREASIYTGIAIAEYFRDMGYDVALMADSTSRWAEALREISGRLEELPIEEGYPSYLAHRLAEFYERAGKRKITSDRIGSISVIGAVSPPGGDFSEPVTVHSKRYTKVFWALDKDLASARHFPSINWIQSFSGYTETVKNHWSSVSSELDWATLRQQALNILKEDDNLQKVVKLIGPDALPDEQRLLLFAASLIKEGFLQQVAFDPVDSFCPLAKQLGLMNAILLFYKRAMRLIAKKVPVHIISAMPVVADILRAKSEIPNGSVDGISKLCELIEISFDKIEEAKQ